MNSRPTGVVSETSEASDAYADKQTALLVAIAKARRRLHDLTSDNAITVADMRTRGGWSAPVDHEIEFDGCG